MSETKTIEERYEEIKGLEYRSDALSMLAMTLLDDLMAERGKMKEALEANMRWIGPPPMGPDYCDSVRQDAWEKGLRALGGPLYLGVDVAEKED